MARKAVTLEWGTIPAHYNMCHVKLPTSWNILVGIPIPSQVSYTTSSISYEYTVVTLDDIHDPAVRQPTFPLQIEIFGMK